MENKDRRVDYYKLLVISAIIVPIIIGFSYAFFLARINITNNTPTTIHGSAASTFDFNLVTQNNGYIKASSVYPIDDSAASTDAEIGRFNVVTGNNTYSVNYSLSLVDILMSDELKTTDFKWALTCTSCSGTSNNASGNFSAVEGSTMLMISNLVIAANTTNQYELRIWLSNTSSDQSNVLGSHFSARVQASGEFIVS